MIYLNCHSRFIILRYLAGDFRTGRNLQEEECMKSMIVKGVLLSLSLTSVAVLANPDVTSREYKLMLDTSKFNYVTEQSDVLALVGDVESVVESAINRNVSGTPQLERVRDVHFYDTPNTCLLNDMGYSFRERVENGISEVTLKFRSPDRYISDYEDVSSSTSGSETKLEADVGANSINNFKVAYGHSTTAPNTRNINDMKDVNAHFDGFDHDYNLSDNLALNAVGGLDISERVYKDVYIDLGSYDAEVSVTLWYRDNPATNTTPLVAEVSFKYKDANADYSRKVVNRAKQSFDAIRTLTSWVDPNSLTKTRFVYQYDPNFCQ
ncbi:hypothetical protein GV055_13665 [Marinomonas mediterranea]|nr:hypothetical protein GV055_13665 [Marinomonas mediterranea]